MTARQPPGEKGAKACTIGVYQSRDWFFCAYFLGVQKDEVHFLAGESYVVHTHWGWFRLDAGAYQDYLDGTLWLSWIPGCPDSWRVRSTGAHSPIVISPKAANLRCSAARSDFCHFLLKHCLSDNVPVPYLPQMKDTPIQNLSLSVRANNCLIHAGAVCFGELWELISNNGLRSIKSLGEKSEREILRSFLATCYGMLTSQEKGVFWQAVIDQPDYNRLEEKRLHSFTMLPVDVEGFLRIRNTL